MVGKENGKFDDMDTKMGDTVYMGWDGGHGMVSGPTITEAGSVGKCVIICTSTNPMELTIIHVYK